MKNFVKNGEVLEIANGGIAIIPSGAVVVMAGLIGIAVANIAVGDTGSVNLEGVYEVPSNVAIPAIGTPMYWNVGTQQADTDATVGPFIGNCAASVCDLEDGVRVLLPGEGRPDSALITQQPNIPVVATANATDLASAEALANALKASHNLVINALVAAGILEA